MGRRRDDVVLCRARIGHAYFTNGYLLRGELRPMYISRLIPYLNYLGIPLQVLLFSSYGNVTCIINY